VAAAIDQYIKISTPYSTNIHADAQQLKFMVSTRSPLMLNVYLYYD
jgi:hypothetical protein